MVLQNKITLLVQGNACWFVGDDALFISVITLLCAWCRHLNEYWEYVLLLTLWHLLSWITMWSNPYLSCNSLSNNKLHPILWRNWMLPREFKSTYQEFLSKLKRVPEKPRKEHRGFLEQFLHFLNSCLPFVQCVCVCSWKKVSLV